MRLYGQAVKLFEQMLFVARCLVLTHWPAVSGPQIPATRNPRHPPVHPSCKQPGHRVMWQSTYRPASPRRACWRVYGIAPSFSCVQSPRNGEREGPRTGGAKVNDLKRSNQQYFWDKEAAFKQNRNSKKMANSSTSCREHCVQIDERSAQTYGLCGPQELKRCNNDNGVCITITCDQLGPCK